MTGMDFPSSPVNGQTTTDGRYYFDSSVGSTGAWRSTPLPVGGLPAGSIMAWGTNTPPANWLLADGTAVSRSTYSSLFAVIGIQYGAGDGTTTFNLPDLRGRVPVGKNGGTFGTLGATGGAETQALTVDQMPAHSHNIRANSHDGYSGTVDLPVAFNRGYPANGIGLNAHVVNIDATRLIPYGQAYADSQGAGAAHNNLQPYQVVNYIIKASAGWTAGDSELATRLGAVEAKQILSPNYVINGGFDVWQRGTSFTANNSWTADRWYFQPYGNGNNANITQVTSNLPDGFRYGLSMKATQTASSNFALVHPLETAHIVPLRGKPVTYSFYYKTPVNWTQGVWAHLFWSTATDTKLDPSATPIISQQLSPSSSWTRFSATATVPATASALTIILTSYNNVVSTAELQIAGVQLEEGSVPTAFRRNAPSIQAELAACQRYYQVIGKGFAGRWNSSTQGEIFGRLPVPMRASPSLTVLGQSVFYNVGLSGAGYSFTISGDFTNVGGQLVPTVSPAIGGSVPNHAAMMSDAIGANAEL